VFDCVGDGELRFVVATTEVVNALAFSPRGAFLACALSSYGGDTEGSVRTFNLNFDVAHKAEEHCTRAQLPFIETSAEAKVREKSEAKFAKLVEDHEQR
jgi:hypothetical protein